jgi:hypothetical protein
MAVVVQGPSMLSDNVQSCESSLCTAAPRSKSQPRRITRMPRVPLLLRHVPGPWSISPRSVQSSNILHQAMQKRGGSSIIITSLLSKCVFCVLLCTDCVVTAQPVTNVVSKCDVRLPVLNCRVLIAFPARCFIMHRRHRSGLMIPMQLAIYSCMLPSILKPNTDNSSTQCSHPWS